MYSWRLMSALEVKQTSGQDASMSAYDPKRTLTDFRFDLDQIQGRCAQTIVNGGCTLRWRPASSGLPVTRRICRSDLADADEPTLCKILRGHGRCARHDMGVRHRQRMRMV